MSSTFTEFLRQQAANRQAELARRREVIEEWTASLRGLYSSLKDWLRQSDPDGILKVEESDDWELQEEGLGKYTVPRLDLRGLGRWIGIVPKARFTVATANPPPRSTPERAEGRVDITNEVRRFILYRFRGEDGDIWMVDDQKQPVRLLDQVAFEAALMTYLR